MIANYIIPFSVNSLQVSIRTQVAFSRDYCMKNKIVFSLPTTENWYSNEYSKLRSLIIDGCSEIIVYSKMLLANEKCYQLLSEFLESRKENMPQFHFSYSDERIDAKTLMIDIQSKLRHERHSMKVDTVLGYLKLSSSNEARNC